ncbi:hypothetical protein ACKVMT_12410 [Halobacteriales archaeon Cl-PHB]
MLPDEWRQDILARGWTPSRRVLSVLAVLLGLLLIANPLVGGLSDAAGLSGNVEYSAAEVTPDGDGLDVSWVDGSDRSVWPFLYGQDELQGIHCYPYGDESTECYLESALVEQNLTLGDVPVSYREYTYQDRFYERIEHHGESDEITLALRPVSARAVLDNVSIPAPEWSDAVRRAVDSGTVSMDPPLRQAGTILERGSTYYVVLSPEPVPEDEPAGPVYTAFCTLLGAGFVQYGRRIRHG